MNDFFMLFAEYCRKASGLANDDTTVMYFKVSKYDMVLELNSGQIIKLHNNYTKQLFKEWLNELINEVI